jgi:hypothetical protein
MKLIDRRDFVRQTAQAAAGLAVSGILACKGRRKIEGNGITAMIPIPIQIVIDDVGWWSGEDGSARQEPYRTGIRRNHVPADYQAIVDLGKGLGVRPQAATILCEWDRKNILRGLPTATWMREKWDNRKWVGPWLEEAADIIRGNKSHYELTLHGIGHEYWADRNFTRAEWADKTGRMRPLDQVELHLDYYARLMEQNRLGPFPESFVPTAFLHGFGPTEGHKTSLAEVIKRRGISYINTPFSGMANAEAVQFGRFGIDSGVMTVDRGEDLFDWNVIGGRPAAKISGPTCGMHWPNLLHQDPERNSEIVAGWVKYLAAYDAGLETLLAPDSSFFQRQLAHHVCTAVTAKGLFVDLDFKKLLTVPEQAAGRRFIVKIGSASRLRFKTENIKLIADSFSREKENFLHTITLERIPERSAARIECIKAA